MTVELVQGSPEWIAARIGNFGASEVHKLVPTKGEGKGRAEYIHRLACERLSGKPQGWEGNAATEDGHRQEPLGRRAYEERTGAFVVTVGLIKHPRLATAHASPDGLVCEEGGLEVKSHVKFTTHLAALEASMPRAHLLQCQWGMACTGMKWWEYGHFCEEAPEHLRLFMFPRVVRDEALIAELEAAVEKAELEVLAKVRRWAPQDIEALLRASLEPA